MGGIPSGVPKLDAPGCCCYACDQERRQLLDQIEQLKGQVEGLKADNDYWVRQYETEVDRRGTASTTYLNVIKVLTGRE